jgi:hypothetical protein
MLVSQNRFHDLQMRERSFIAYCRAASEREAPCKRQYGGILHDSGASHKRDEQVKDGETREDFEVWIIGLRLYEARNRCAGRPRASLGIFTTG